MTELFIARVRLRVERRTPIPRGRQMPELIGGGAGAVGGAIYDVWKHNK